MTTILSIESFLSGLLPHGSIFILVSVFFFGEAAMLTAFGWAAQGHVSLTEVFACSFIAIMVADLLWFLVGDGFLRFFGSSKHRETYKKGVQPLSLFLERIVGRYLVLSLLFSKFLYGIRPLVLIYLGARKTPLSLFLFFNALGTIIFMAALFLIGWPIGAELYALLPQHGELYSLIALIAVITALVAGAHFWLKRAVTEEIDETEHEALREYDAAGNPSEC